MWDLQGQDKILIKMLIAYSVVHNSDYNERAGAVSEGNAQMVCQGQVLILGHPSLMGRGSALSISLMGLTKH